MLKLPKSLKVQYHGTSLFEMTPVERLSFVGTKGMGALCYIPEMVINTHKDTITLEKMQQDALDVLQAREMFRRMIFNFEIANNDDHAKNFSFIFSDGRWTCSPAYDITRCPNANNGFHSSLVNGKENPNIEDFIAVGSEAGLSKGQVIDAVQDIKTVVRRLAR